MRVVGRRHLESVVLRNSHADMGRNGVVDSAIFLYRMEKHSVIKALRLDKIADLLLSGLYGSVTPLACELHKRRVADGF